MKVLLLGSTGYIGRVVLERLLENGHDVAALVRSQHGPTTHPAGVQLVAGDATDPAGVGDLVIASGVEAAIHVAGIDDWNIDQKLVETLAAALGEQPHRVNGHGAAPLVYTSGTWVLGPTHDQPADELSPANPIPLVAGRETVEAAVLAQDKVRPVVIRPGIVHGRAGGIPEMLVAWAREDGVGRYVLDPDTGSAVWPMVHVDDLAGLYVLAVEDTRAHGVLHGVAETAVAVDELAAAAADAAGVLPGSRPWDLFTAAEQIGLPFAQALSLAQRVEAPVARALGWTPTRARAVDELRVRRARRFATPHPPAMNDRS